MSKCYLLLVLSVLAAAATASASGLPENYGGSYGVGFYPRGPRYPYGDSCKPPTPAAMQVYSKGRTLSVTLSKVKVGLAGWVAPPWNPLDPPNPGETVSISSDKVVCAGRKSTTGYFRYTAEVKALYEDPDDKTNTNKTIIEVANRIASLEICGCFRWPPGTIQFRGGASNWTVLEYRGLLDKMDITKSGSTFPYNGKTGILRAGIKNYTKLNVEFYD